LSAHTKRFRRQTRLAAVNQGRGVYTMIAEEEVLELLRSWEAGEPRALAKLMPLVCDDLCRLARSLLRREAEGHTLEPGALVSEVYLRLRALRSPRWESCDHFYNSVVCLMRQILVDHARAGKRMKRGWGIQHLPLESAADQAAAPGDEQGALNDALLDLRRIDPQRFRIVALRCFVGLTTEETAAACGVSLSTVKRDWCEARVWLQQALTGGTRPAAERRGARLAG
ncbi:MAG TPA: ECF-type sigma factor, partial [Thermoanaerobaculia bacterium]|nr:ECF-type sigma factor [Thermoanaerobaculia bacterium]